MHVRTSPQGGVMAFAAALMVVVGCQSPRFAVADLPAATNAGSRVCTSIAAAGDEESTPPSRDASLEKSSSEPDRSFEILKTAYQVENSPAAYDDGVAPDPDGLSLEQVEQLALQYNPTIRQQSASATKATAVRQQSALYPNPVMGYLGVQLADRGTDQHGLLLEQEIVLGDKLNLNRQVHQQDVQVRLWEVEAQRQRVLTDVRQLFYRALAVQRRLQLTGDYQQVTRRGAELARLRLEGLQASRPEMLQAEIQDNEVSLTLQQTEIELQAVWRQLAAATGASELKRSTLIGSLDPRTLSNDWDLVLADLQSRSPELNAARTEVQRARMYLCRQQAQPIPNLNLQLVGGQDNGTNNGFLNVQATAAVPVLNQNEGNIRAAYADYCRATHDVRRLELSLQSRLAETAQTFDRAAASVQMYRDQIIPRAQETLDLAEQAYAAGEFDFLQILLARRTWFESRIRYVEALGQLAEANAAVNGMLLTGGLDTVSDYTGDDTLRGQALEGR